MSEHSINCTRTGATVHALAHQALFYRSAPEYVDGVLRFIAPGLEDGDPVAVAVPPARAGLLRERLDEVDANIEFLNMVELGRNPARVIPVVSAMLARRGGRKLHWVGEPIWPGRSEREIREATRHEALINLAWPGAAIRVLCPYDATALDPGVLTDAQCTHPWVIQEGELRHSPLYEGPAVPSTCEERLSEPPPGSAPVEVKLAALCQMRAGVAHCAARAGLSGERTQDLVLAVNEVASNTIKHTGAAARLRLWSEDDEVICQLEDPGYMDPGYIVDPLAGRRLPTPDARAGIGLWMVNQLCDLVEVRSQPEGTIIRLHASLN